MIPRFHISSIHRKQLDGQNKNRNNLKKLKATALLRTQPIEQLPTGASLYDRCFKSWKGLEFRMGKPPIVVGPGCTMTLGSWSPQSHSESRYNNWAGYTVTKIVDRIKFSWDFDSKAADMRTFSKYLEDHFTHDYWNTTLPLWDLTHVEFEMMPMGSTLWQDASTGGLLRTEGWRKLDPEDLIFPAASTNWKGKGVSSGHGAPGKVRVRGLKGAYILRISITLEVEKDKAMIARSRLVPHDDFDANTAFELYTMLHPSFNPGNRSMVFTMSRLDKLRRSLKKLSTTVYFEPKYSPI